MDNPAENKILNATTQRSRRPTPPDGDENECTAANAGEERRPNRRGAISGPSGEEAQAEATSAIVEERMLHGEAVYEQVLRWKEEIADLRRIPRRYNRFHGPDAQAIRAEEQEGDHQNLVEMSGGRRLMLKAYAVEQFRASGNWIPVDGIMYFGREDREEGVTDTHCCLT